MRITKKFAGPSCIGKQIFQPMERSASVESGLAGAGGGLSLDDIRGHEGELDKLEKAFRHRQGQSSIASYSSSSPSAPSSSSPRPKSSPSPRFPWSDTQAFQTSEQHTCTDYSAATYSSDGADDYNRGASSHSGRGSGPSKQSRSGDETLWRESMQKSLQEQLLRDKMFPATDINSFPKARKGGRQAASVTLSRRSVSAPDLNQLLDRHNLAFPPPRTLQAGEARALDPSSLFLPMRANDTLDLEQAAGTRKRCLSMVDADRESDMAAGI